MSHSHSGHASAHSGHRHAHAVPASRALDGAFVTAIGLNVSMVVGEAAAGMFGHSMALIADAGHNLSDVLGLAAAFAAHRLGRRPPSSRYTYGLGGTSILAALANAVLLLLITGGLCWAALSRFASPEPIAAKLVMAVAALAIVVNGVSAWLLRPRGTGDLNLRAAMAHLATDALVAAGVVLGAALILATGWRWIDPAISLIIAATIVIGTWGILRESLALSLAAVPAAVEPEEVRGDLRALRGVGDLHDLHIWAVSTSRTALTVHLVMPDGHPGDAFLGQACELLRTRHGIDHATIQVETGPGPCALAPEHVV